MAKKLEKNTELSSLETYDVWDLTNSGQPLGSYFVPKGVTGEEYEALLATVKDKLINLGFTTLEAKTILGRQLF